ncbi:hypothetical protein BDE36_3757 [Arcticibacter tournemirensis]|uniref:Uncharacterized protein n=1 Tax=Arcticibacter tournemirensis TaxID=699437 RepID=A0A5M9HCS3_9SPHI|nr:hypothetical protein [Arcticibacter tournemirensis]KAA8483124.1 hypothetical protein F1649_09945 [Arcticibacter tournemirensis]TQM51963.1 hypothetical protein BDE36_3757 [Arcticibacter tournemirensis]
MKTFSSIKQLLNILSREQKLISEIFEKRKVLAYKYDDALEVLEYNEDKLRILIEYAVLRENGSFLELDDQFLQFFEQILEVNEEINVSYINENLQSIRQNILYYLQENSESRRYAYLRQVKSALRKTGTIAIRNVVDLKRNIDNTFKNEPNYQVKKAKLEHLDLKRNDISTLISLTDNLISGDDEQTFFKIAADEELQRIILNLKGQLNICRHNLIDAQKQIIEYLNRLRSQSILVEKIRQLKYLKDQFELRTKTNIVQVLGAQNPLLFEAKPAYALKLSLDQLQVDDASLELIRKVQARSRSGQRIRQSVADTNLQDYLETGAELVSQVNLEEVKNSFLAGSNNLFDFLESYDFGMAVSFADRLTIYCQLISQYDTQFRLTDQYQIKHESEYLLIYPL